MKKFSKNQSKDWNENIPLPRGYVDDDWLKYNFFPKTKTIFNAGKLLRLLNIPEEEANELEICCALYNMGAKKAKKVIERCITTYQMK